MGVWGRKDKDDRKSRKKRKNSASGTLPAAFKGLGNVGGSDAPKDPPKDGGALSAGGEEPEDSGRKRTKEEVENWRRPRFVGQKDEAELDDPVEIVNVLLNGLRAQGITADRFKEIAGFGRNTLSKWKRNVTVPPEWIGFLFKVLVMEMQSGTNMVEFLEEVENYKI